MKDRSPAPTGLPHNFTDAHFSSTIRTVQPYRPTTDKWVARYRFEKYTDRFAEYVAARAA
jgi:cupin superfamily acireductone dioxygenase involved in methionine salvage